MEDVHAKFAALDVLRTNGWKTPQKVAPPKKKVLKVSLDRFGPFWTVGPFWSVLDRSVLVHSPCSTHQRGEIFWKVYNELLN